MPDRNPGAFCVEHHFVSDASFVISTLILKNAWEEEILRSHSLQNESLCGSERKLKQCLRQHG